jgi:hypothetical protein
LPDFALRDGRICQTFSPHLLSAAAIWNINDGICSISATVAEKTGIDCGKCLDLARESGIAFGGFQFQRRQQWGC